MLRAHKIELRLTAVQERYLRRCAGTMRYTYNQLVAKFNDGEKYSRKDWQKFCSTMRKEIPWMNKVCSRATYEAADNFHRAVSRFFDSVKKGKRPEAPKFKKKGRADKFQFSHSSQFRTENRFLRIQGLRSNIRMRERIRFLGNIRSVSISSRAGKWYASFLVETPREVRSSQSAAQREPSCGVDLGISRLAVLSTGEMWENPRPLQKSLKLLRRRQRQVSRKFVRGAREQSRRYRRAKNRMSKIHKRVLDYRSAAQHALTTSLVRRFDRIVIEDLNVWGLRKNRRLSRAISDAGWGTIRRQLGYKCPAHDVELVIADRYFASSKTCSDCGTKTQDLKLSQRVFRCPVCGNVKDRDVNAAINLDNYSVATDQGETLNGRSRLSKTSLEAGSPEGVNINPTLKEDLCEAKVTLV